MHTKKKGRKIHTVPSFNHPDGCGKAKHKSYQLDIDNISITENIYPSSVQLVSLLFQFWVARIWIHIPSTTGREVGSHRAQGYKNKFIIITFS